MALFTEYYPMCSMTQEQEMTVFPLDSEWMNTNTHTICKAERSIISPSGLAPKQTLSLNKYTLKKTKPSGTREGARAG